MRIPYDSLTLAAVTRELQAFVGAKVQRIVQLDEHTVVLGLYPGGGEGYLLLSCDPTFFRAHLITKRPGGQGQPPAFCMALRSRMEGGRVTSIRQIGFDRILHMTVEHPLGEHTLVAELMGKHSNLMLVGPDHRIVAPAKVVGPSKSSRPVSSGRPYEPPPFEPRPSLLDAKSGEELKDREGASPFLLKLMKAGGIEAAELKAVVREGRYAPVLSAGHGAYPVSVAALDLPEHPRSEMSIALEQHYDLAIPAYETEQLRQSMLSQLNRVLLAREVALNELHQAEDTAARAGRMQLMGELILAYGRTLPEGSKMLGAEDYEGNPIQISLEAEMDYLANANRYFERAKKAKRSVGMVKDQIARLQKDHADVGAFILRVEAETRLIALRDLQEQARERRWLHTQIVPAAKKEDRPYEGHKIRELLGPQGLKILYGETATANDYLTMRVAKPNDYWLHVRAAVSAHVIIATNNHPEKVGREALVFAAKVAVQHSPSKHGGYVPVDYTLKKYVRKPRGAPAGTALYTHEKTLHIEP
jgi:predicted ribosome quality control (RQC) complex YloA/Tae2 family protein